MAYNDKLNLINKFTLQGFDVQHNLYRTNDKMRFPVVKDGDTNDSHGSTIYSLLLIQKLISSVSMTEKSYTIDYSKYLNSIYVTIPAEDIVCAYVDIGRSIVVSPETAYPFGVPTLSGEIVTCNVNFIQNTIALYTKGDWHRYEAFIVLNLVIKDNLADILVSDSMPIRYNEFVK